MKEIVKLNVKSADSSSSYLAEVVVLLTLEYPADRVSIPALTGLSHGLRWSIVNING